MFLSVGWRLTFLLLGGLCLLWIPLWYIINKTTPKEHPWVTDEEREYIIAGQDEIEQKETEIWSLRQLLKDNHSYSVIAGRFFLNPIWWMFMTWLPIYLQEVYHLNLIDVASVAWIPFVGVALYRYP